MDKLLSFLRLEFASGNRTKYGLLIVGLLLFLFDSGILSPDVWAQITKYAPYILGFFGIEHLDKYFGVKK